MRPASLSVTLLVCTNCPIPPISDAPNDKAAKVPDLEINPVTDGYVVYQPDRYRVHCLNQTAALMFEFRNGRAAETHLTNPVQSAYDLASPPVDAVKECLDALRNEGLVA
jgi:hypothetical protein